MRNPNSFRRYLRLITILVILTLGFLLLKEAMDLVEFRKHLPSALFGAREGELNSLNISGSDQILSQTVLPIIPSLKTVLQCHDHPLKPEKLQYGSYWALKNYIRGSISKTVGCADTLTYTTMGDYTFLDNLPMLVTRWMAPISFAVFAPGYDFGSAMTSIEYLRNCLPASAAIRNFVTFHLFFPHNHMPEHGLTTEEGALDRMIDCLIEEPPYLNANKTEMYKNVNKLAFPINVARNIARKAANTHFILASDAELYPTEGLPQQFLDMIANNVSLLGVDEQPRVFPLPVFELEANASIPSTKTELAAMLQNKTAFPFHFKLCNDCHRVPKEGDWEEASDSQQLSVFTVSKREDKFQYWEPFYISDNTEPIFDERVTWEGMSDKRVQGYAMCLLEYEYHVLHPAFLVHKPGIKVHNFDDPRFKYMAPMNRIIRNEIIPEYKKLYGGNHTRCSV